MTALLIDRRGPVLVWTVSRPATRNAVDVELADALHRALDTLGDARAVVLRGDGGTFISGGDLLLIRERPFAETLLLSRRMTDLLARFEAAPVPIVAAVEGYAYGGGCEVMLACDYSVAHPGAKLSFRQAAMGLTTGWGATTRLAKRVPRGVATRLLMTAEVLGAIDANSVGLVDEVSDTPLERAVSIARAMSQTSAAAVDAFKKTLAAAYGAEASASAAAEWSAFEALWGGPDHRAALDAYFAARSKSATRE